MELLYLFCSIVSTFFTSLILSLLLPFRVILRRSCSSSAAVSSPTHAGQSVSFYEGTVWHERRRPVLHSFQYPVRYAFFDLDHALHAPPDHHYPDYARQIARTAGPVFLLTIPPSVGYEQNPLSLYYCYDLEGSTPHLKKCIAEVTNTPWGERVSFVFDPNSDVVAKPLHVSPFMDMLGTWSIRTNSPGEKLYVAISVKHPKLGDYFVATLTAKRVSSYLASDPATFFWLMPHKVALWIYWQALKLWWKNLKFIQHPRYTNPAYRGEAIARDQKLKCCQALLPDKEKHLQVERSQSVNTDARSSKGRWCAWRDAKWPWS